ncbi:unnamed protein product [Rotaria sp. Silwood1]|nr:unnamed protein product [Rotaria sp. Silwood1]
MPHESTVDPEEPMHFKSWDEYTSVSSIHTHPDLPLHVTHDHDNDSDPDDDSPSNVGQDLDSDLQSRVTNTPPKRNVKSTEK